jgi:hypothetical protein
VRGKDAALVATFSDGREQELLNVPNHGLNWQLQHA